MEPIKLYTCVWRVGVYILYPLCELSLVLLLHSCFHLSLMYTCFINFFRADFHDYHHRLLYTKSGNYSSTFVYMDWWVEAFTHGWNVSLFLIFMSLYLLHGCALVRQVQMDYFHHSYPHGYCLCGFVRHSNLCSKHKKNISFAFLCPAWFQK